MDDLIKQIKSNVDHPGELERLYRDNQLEFVEAYGILNWLSDIK